MNGDSLPTPSRTPGPTGSGLRFDVAKRRGKGAADATGPSAATGHSCGCGCSSASAAADPPERPSACCAPKTDSDGSSCCGGAKAGRPDWLLWLPLAVLVPALACHWGAPALLAAMPAWLVSFAHAAAELAAKAWWGIAAGIVAVAVIGRIPRELVVAALGRGHSLSGILRATAAGVLLDLCNHGILLVAMQLYKKGASTGQTLAFLIASPWNSLSLTLILASLIGWKWMIVFVGLSAAIGVVAGLVADRLVTTGKLPANPNSETGLSADFRLKPALRALAVALVPTPRNLGRLAIDGMRESRMILRWIFLGIVLAAAIRALVPDASFAAWFGPSLGGLLWTLLATTAIEVCTEGSSPVAADLLTRAHAPGNAFTFLMGGAATDLTALLALRQTTGSWKIALALIWLTLPQVFVVSWLLNQA